MKTFILFFLVVFCYSQHVSGQTNELQPPPPVNNLFNEKTQAFAYVEQMPQFKGGHAEMYKFIGANIYMPDTCRKMGVAGQVIVQFVVDSMGYVTNTKVARNTSIDCGYGEVALEMLERMNHPEPHWMPGRHEGKPVNVSFMLPVKFAFSD